MYKKYFDRTAIGESARWQQLFLLRAALLFFSFVLMGAMNVASAAVAAYERFYGVVVDSLGKPLDGATVTVNGIPFETIKGGQFQIYAEKASRYAVTTNGPSSGYAMDSQIFKGTGNTAMKIVLKKGEEFTLNLTGANKLTDSKGTTIELPLNALINPLTGARPLLGTVVKATVYTYDLKNEAMPGDMKAKDAQGNQLPLVSSGAFFAEFTSTDATGKVTKYNLDPLVKATVSVPAVNGNSTIGMYSFNEQTGFWVKEGDATQINGLFVANKVIGHFSAWNFDMSTPRENQSCIKLDVDSSFFSKYSASGLLKVKAKITGTNGYPQIRYLSFFSNDTQKSHLFEELPSNSTMELYAPIVSNGVFTGYEDSPYGYFTSGAPWDKTQVDPNNYYGPKYPYTACNGYAKLSDPKTPQLGIDSYGDYEIQGLAENKQYYWQVTCPAYVPAGPLVFNGSLSTGISTENAGFDSMAMGTSLYSNISGVMAGNFLPATNYSTYSYGNTFSLGSCQLAIKTSLTANYLPVTGAGLSYNPTITRFLRRQTYSSIMGMAFNDANLNGRIDLYEGGRAGWTVTLKNASNAVVGTPQITNALGIYKFTNVTTAGNYTVTITPKAGTTYTTPQSAVTTVTLTRIPKAVNFGVKTDGSNPPPFDETPPIK